jgi:hypothetical protein
MTKGIPRKQRLAEQRHARCVQGAVTLASAAKTPPRAVPIATKAPRLSVGLSRAVSEPLPAHSYPAKRAQLGKPQTAGGR